MITRRISVGLVVPLLLACSEVPTDPVSPAGPEVAYSQAGGPERQTGHWEITSPVFPTMQIGKYSASAIRQSDGSVAGNFEVHEHYADHTDRVHGVTTCLLVLPDGTARAGGVITESSNPAYVGTEAVWIVKDNGQGRNAPPDLATDIRYGFAPQFNVAQRFCALQVTPILMGVNPVIRGNIQVTGP